MTVLDASAVLALIQDEPGAREVEAVLSGARMGAANLAEVVGKLVDAGLEASRVRGLLESAGVEIEPVTDQDAELAGAMRALPGGRALSLGVWASFFGTLISTAVLIPAKTLAEVAKTLAGSGTVARAIG